MLCTRCSGFKSAGNTSQKADTAVAAAANYNFTQKRSSLFHCAIMTIFALALILGIFCWKCAFGFLNCLGYHMVVPEGAWECMDKEATHEKEKCMRVLQYLSYLYASVVDWKHQSWKHRAYFSLYFKADYLSSDVNLLLYVKKCAWCLTVHLMRRVFFLQCLTKKK